MKNPLRINSLLECASTKYEYKFTEQEANILEAYYKKKLSELQ